MLLLCCYCLAAANPSAKATQKSIASAAASSLPHCSHNIVPAVSSLARQQIKAAGAASHCIVPVAEACRKDDQGRLLLLLLMLLREFRLLLLQHDLLLLLLMLLLQLILVMLLQLLLMLL